MPKAYVTCDYEVFPSPPYGGQAVWDPFSGSMKILVKELPPTVATKEIRDARYAENCHRTLEWVRQQRLGR